MKTISILSIFWILSFVSYGQTKTKKVSIIIQTSAQCGDCKERIEGALNMAKGVKNAELDMETKKVSVIYNASKTNFENLAKVLNESGYDANDHRANPEAVKKLPKCCQPGGH